MNETSTQLEEIIKRVEALESAIFSKDEPTEESEETSQEESEETSQEELDKIEKFLKEK